MKKKYLYLKHTWLLLLFLQQTVFSQTCPAATEFTVTTSCVTSAFNSRQDTDYWNSPSGCGATDNDDKWLWFTAIHTSTTITYTPETRDAVLHLFTGTCATNMTSLACADVNGDGGAETITYATTVGQVYRVRIQRFQDNGNMNGTMCIYSVIPAPTITSLGSSSGCLGSTLVINGTNLSSASAATIGGTAATITAQTATSVTVTVGSGTTGTVQVTTGGGTATSAATYTVNPLPVITTQPVATGICTSGSGTLSVAATGATTYQWFRSGTPLTNTAPYSGVTTNTLTITNPAVAETGSFYVVVSNASGCSVTSSTITLTVSAIPPTVIIPTPTSGATGICYSGGGSITSIGWAASTGATNYDVYFGAGALPGSVTANVATNAYTTGALVASTTYFWRVVARNSCGNAVTSATFTFTTAAAPCVGTYCTYATTSSSYWINNVTTANGFVNFNNPSTYSAGGYANYSGSQFVNEIAGGSFNISVTTSSGTHGINVWVDWNNDNDFSDAGETVYASGAYVTSVIGALINVPGATPNGTYRMRIAANWLNTNPSSCGTSTYTEAEDYSVIIGPAPTCYSPNTLTSTALTQTTGSATWTAPISGSAPVNYEYIITSVNITPTGTGTATGALTASFTGLLPSTTYFVYVRTNCGSGDFSFWRSTSFTTPCQPGDGNGVSAAACPNVLAGGLGLNGLNPPAIDCTAPTTITNLEASFLNLGNTSSYAVTSIPYAPPYQFECLANPVSVNIDDVWSPTVNFPFGFCFYGTEYSNCLISSNGVITFDTVNNIPSGSSAWSFANNLPSTSLFENSIFGVYHDIDPSKGGTVGWELVTLDTGCRALVAAWNNVPMFSDNSKKYTGMMVFYENTNIIEVYVKEKVVDGTWNGGNAVIGVQNAAGTVATVPPNRNSLSTDWTTSNEAWRFTPNGTSITTFTWYQGPDNTGTVLGTSPTLTVSPAATTTYTAEAVYTYCNGDTAAVMANTTVTVGQSKVWTGFTNTNWNIGSNWLPLGVPTLTDCVIIPNVTNDPIISGTNFEALGLNLIIQNSGFLTLNGTNYLKLQSNARINTGGRFDVLNNGSLLQLDNTANLVTGTFNYNRTAPLIKGSDYVYWTSPVANQALSSIYTTPTQGPSYQWNTTAANANSGLGTWGTASANMGTAAGYIVRGSSTYGMAATNINATFTGNPNNGNISINAPRGNMTPFNVGAALTYSNPSLNSWDDNWSLLGNPYPSAINALSFLSVNSANLMGTVRLWRHLSDPAPIPSPFYQTFAYNYNSSDYLTINFTGPTTPGAGDIIKAGQGFMVQRREGAQDLTGVPVNFTNAMRLTTTSTVLDNTGFFRTANNINNEPLNRSRVWLDIVDNTTLSSETTLLGYVDEATNGFDSQFDATIGITSAIGIYSFADDQKCIIQGKPNPFSVSDEVPLGINVHSNGNYHIAIKAIDGVFGNNGQTIYLEDKLLNMVHNLTISPYLFNSNAGTYNDRFVLKYSNTVLSTPETNWNNAISIYGNSQININSSIENIKEVNIYNVLGKTIFTESNIDKNIFEIQSVQKQNQMLIVKVTLNNDQTVIKKVLY